MTGFGRGEVAWEGGALSSEVRSVNSRHLDLRLRLPRELTALESALRARVSEHFSRGQVDVQIRLPAHAGVEPSLEVSEVVARRYVDAAARLRADLGIDGELPLAELLQLPGVAQLREPEIDPERIAEALLEAVGAACAAAAEMRTREGETLERDLVGRLGQVETIVAEIEERAEEVRKGVRDRLQRRLQALNAEVELDPARLDQEVLYHVDRMDVTEETVRLRSHLGQFRETLVREGPVGRKLEFILQEMGREANTVGSKASDSSLGRQVVELRSCLEKLREQVLNVE